MWMLRTERSNVEKWQKIVEKQTHAEAKLRSWRFKTIAEAFIWMATTEKKKNLNILKVKMISEVVSDQKTYRRRTSRRLKKNIWNICFCFWREHAAHVQSVLTGCTVFSSTSSHWSNFLHVHIKTKKMSPSGGESSTQHFLISSHLQVASTSAVGLLLLCHTLSVNNGLVSFWQNITVSSQRNQIQRERDDNWVK